MLTSLFLVSLLGFLLISFFTSSKIRSLAAQSHAQPPSFPFFGCLISFYKNRRRLLAWYTHLLSLSPSQTIVIRRLGARRTVITANPKNVEYMLKTRFDNFPKGQPMSELLGDLLGSGIFNVDGELWKTQRKLASHEFTARSLRDLVLNVLREEVEDRLLKLLDKVSERGEAIDLQEVLRKFAFDVVCKVSLGFDPSCLDETASEPVPALASAFDTAAAISAMRSTEPMYVVWKMKRLLNVGSERKLKEAIRTVHQCVWELIKTKKKQLDHDEEKNHKNHDLLSRFLEAGLDEVVVRDMVISFIMAGRDTTSAAMTWLFWLLSDNNDVEKEILKEVNDVIGDYGVLDYDALKRMNFTKACLYESMRLYPPVAWDSKHAATDDVLPDGTRVGKGERVTYFPYGMGRMEALWGEDCFEFKPVRWFEDEPVGSKREKGIRVMKSVSPFKFSVFQAGPRVCLGKEMALVQMKYVVGSVLRRFEIEPVGTEKPVFVPLLTAHMAGGFQVKIKRREEVHE